MEDRVGKYMLSWGFTWSYRGNAKQGIFFFFWNSKRHQSVLRPSNPKGFYEAKS